MRMWMGSFAKWVCITLCFYGFSLAAHAGETGRVKRIYPSADGNVYFWLDGGCKTKLGMVIGTSR